MLSPGASFLPSRSLGAGSRIALIAPAGPLSGDSELQVALDNAARLGWDAVPGVSVSARDGYFAGRDEARLSDLRWAIEDESIDGIWCVRGGYGATRLLPHIDMESVVRANKPIIGFSDVTALHALWQRAGAVSYHGPTARAELSEFSRDAFVRAVQDVSSFTLSDANAVVIRGGKARGRLAGGNLALLSALCGTPWQCDFRDAIVVIEDIGEAMYRIDRMLVQLRLANVFDGCAGLVFGQFTSCPEEAGDGARTLRSLVVETARAVGVPTLMSVPVGHIRDQWTLPFGCECTLDADGQSLAIHRERGR